MMKTVSIIVPVYNSENSLRRCIDSILSQTYENFHIIMVDDGSNDASLQICMDYKRIDSRIDVIHQKNCGVSVARNRGLDAAIGDYLMFVDSDDWIEADTLETALQNMKDDTDIVTFSFTYENNGQAVTCILEKSDYNLADLFTKKRKERETVLCTIWNKLYSLKPIRENHIRFDQGIHFGEDFLFNVKVYSYAKKIVIIPNLLYHYDCSSETSSVKRLYNNYDDFINLMDSALCNLMNSFSIDEELEDKVRKEFIGSRWNYATNICLSSKNSIKDKARIIYGWVQEMPMEIFQSTEVANADLKRLFPQGRNVESLHQLKIRIVLLLGLKKIKHMIFRIKAISKRIVFNMIRRRKL